MWKDGHLPSVQTQGKFKVNVIFMPHLQKNVLNANTSAQATLQPAQSMELILPVHFTFESGEN